MICIPGKEINIDATKTFRKKLASKSDLREIFDKQIKSIEWKTKLAKETIEIPQGKEVTEIEFFWLNVNTKDIDERILRFFDKEVGYHLIFILENEGKIQIWLSDKNAAQTNQSYFTINRYYHTGWFPSDMLFLFTDGENLDEVYLSLFKQIQKIESDYNILLDSIILAPKSAEVINAAKENIPLSQQEIESILAVKPISDNQKEKICKSYLRVAIKLSLKFLNRCEEGKDSLEDCIADACVGIMKAIDSYDAKVNGYFSSYVERYIWRALELHRINREYLIYIPPHIHDILRKMGMIETQFYKDNNRKPTIAEYVEKLHLSPHRIRKLLEIRNNSPISLSTPIGEDDAVTLEDFIEDKNGANPESLVTDSFIKQEVSEVLATLSEREAKIIKLRFGIESGYPRTLEEVGKIFNITRERVRQIETKAIRKLRRPSRTRMIKDCN